MAGVMHEQTQTLQGQLDACGAEWMNFGPQPSEGGIAIAETFGAYEAEYAAIRQRVGILHAPQRGLLRCTGEDRQDFLHRMASCDVNSLEPGQSVRGFQLGDKGRIVADLVIHHGSEETWVETDRFDLSNLWQLLDGRLFAEDLTIEDFSDQRQKLVLHGPAAMVLLKEVVDEPASVDALSAASSAHHVVRIAAAPVTVYRRDETGAPGLHLFAPADAAAAVYRALLDAAGFDPGAEVDASFAEQRRQSLRGRPIGWLAYNTARIEAGTPLFHVDFGPDSLPHETGLVYDACSFTKGCYLGQEIVARMESLGHPKRVLTGLKLPGEAMPVTGAQVFAADDSGAQAGDTVIGAVTSATVSPMRGGLAIAFAVMKWGRHEPGETVFVSCEGQMTAGETHALKFLETSP
jgi:folate-binding protein YgfZ